MKSSGLSKGLRQMRFMRRLKEERDEIDEPISLDSKLAEVFFGRQHNANRGVVVDHRHTSFCDFGFLRFSYHNFNPEIEKLMLENKMERDNESKAPVNSENEDEVEVSKEEMSKMYNLKQTIAKKFTKKRQRKLYSTESLTCQSDTPSSANSSGSKKCRTISPVSSLPLTRGQFMKPET